LIGFEIEIESQAVGVSKMEAVSNLCIKICESESEPLYSKDPKLD
jgi:hypothetical protein